MEGAPTRVCQGALEMHVGGWEPFLASPSQGLTRRKTQVTSHGGWRWQRTLLHITRLPGHTPAANPHAHARGSKGGWDWHTLPGPALCVVGLRAAACSSWNSSCSLCTLCALARLSRSWCSRHLLYGLGLPGSSSAQKRGGAGVASGRGVPVCLLCRCPHFATGSRSGLERQVEPMLLDVCVFRT